MTEKRFTVDSDGKYFDRVNQRYVTLDKLFDELNMLHEENTELRTALKELKEIGDYQADRIAELDNENMKLEDQLKNLRRLANEVYMEQNE